MSPHHRLRNWSIGSLRPVARFAPDPVLMRILPRCPGRLQGQRGRACSHRLAALPGRLGGCLRERDGGGGGLSAVVVMHGCDAVAAIQGCRQVQPATPGRRRSAAPGSIIGGARLVRWAFRRPGELAGRQRGAGVSLGRESILSFVLCVYALGTPEGVGGVIYFVRTNVDRGGHLIFTKFLLPILFCISDS